MEYRKTSLSMFFFYLLHLIHADMPEVKTYKFGERVIHTQELLTILNHMVRYGPLACLLSIDFILLNNMIWYHLQSDERYSAYRSVSADFFSVIFFRKLCSHLD